MRFTDFISLIIDNLSRRKGRVLLTAIGVVIGTAAVVTLVSLGVGLQQSATSQLWGINDLTSIEVYPGYPMPEGPMAQVITEDDIKRLTPDAVESFKAIPGVTQVVVKQYIQGGMEISLDKLSAWGSAMGVNLTDLKDIGLEASQGETTISRGKVVVGSAFNNNFYDPNPRPNSEPITPPDLMGQKLKIKLTRWSEDGTTSTKSYALEVVGVLAESRGESDYSMYMVLDEVTQWNEWFAGKRIDYKKDGYNAVTVKVESPKIVVDITNQITDMGYQAYTPQSTVEGINSYFSTMQLVFGGIGAIALLVAAIGIANTMTMAILERTREIGIMKAVGATNNNILTIFLGEAAGIGFLGGIGGVLVGWAICAVINALGGSMLANGGGMGTQLAASIPFWLPVFSIAFATLIGLISGLYPALNAATLIPVDALKYE
jgi:putative ABC transport system permease protein